MSDAPKSVRHADVIALLKRIAPHEQRVRRQFQQLPLQAYQRTRRVLDGEELDWDQVLDHHTELQRGASPDERVYQRRDRVTRDVAAAFLIDLSASTDDPVGQARADDRRAPMTTIRFYGSP